jgi:SAM-dependent methyltransferase
VSEIFISHSSQDRELINQVVDLLETGAGVNGEGIFASSVEGRDIPSSVDYRAYIKQTITDAALSIFLLTPNFYRSPFCMAELGAAWVLDSPMLVFTVPPLKPEEITDVAGSLQLEELHTQKSLDKLRDLLGTNLGVKGRVTRWNSKRDEFLTWLGDQPITDVEEQPTWKDRGWWDSDIVDGTLYIGNGYMRSDHTKTIQRMIRDRRVLPTIYAYLTNAGYRNWINLTKDPRYTYFLDAVALYTREAERLATKITQAVGDTNLDVVSLGCGTGVKDQQLLRALASIGSAGGLYYYPFDISPSMISSAMELVGGDEDLSEIKVKAILAEFNSLPQFYKVYQYREGPNVLMLLGNTLGNLPDEREFLERIFTHAMKDGDLFLLDVRNQEVGEKPEKDLGTLRLNRRFDFGPLDILSVPYEPEKVIYDKPPGEPSKVPETQTWRAKYKECEIDGTTYQDVTLSYIHRYKPSALLAVLEHVGFHKLDDLHEGSATAFLLQKPR